MLSRSSSVSAIFPVGEIWSIWGRWEFLLFNQTVTVKKQCSVLRNPLSLSSLTYSLMKMEPSSCPEIFSCQKSSLTFETQFHTVLWLFAINRFWQKIQVCSSLFKIIITISFILIHQTIGVKMWWNASPQSSKRSPKTMVPRGGAFHLVIILVDKQSIRVKSVYLRFLLKVLQNICFPVAFHLTLFM